MPKAEQIVLALDGHDVPVTNPSKVYFPAAGITKLELVQYYLAVADGALRGVARRPMNLKRYVNGIDEEPFYQKRAAVKRPDWIETVRYTFPSGRSADEITVTTRAQLVYVVNLGCIDLHPHPVRREDMDHPDELRIDLDPVPGVPWSQIVEVAQVVHEVLDDVGLVGWPKTSGSRGIHIWARIEPKWPFRVVRRAALAFAREVERRAPTLATAKWWKEERHGVFVDFNQNARDRTTASAYSVRPVQDARVSMPLTWAELAAVNPEDFTLKTVPGLYAVRGDVHAGIDDAVGSLDRLLLLADQQDAAGAQDAPHPMHEPKAAGEPTRIAPSRAKGAAKPATPKVKLPVITIANAKLKVDALAGLERWKARHPALAAALPPAAFLVDSNRGRSSMWYRIRINLVTIPEADRPPPEAPDPDYDWKSEYGA